MRLTGKPSKPVKKDDVGDRYGHGAAVDSSPRQGRHGAEDVEAVVETSLLINFCLALQLLGLKSEGAEVGLRHVQHLGHPPLVAQGYGVVAQSIDRCQVEEKADVVGLIVVFVGYPLRQALA